MRQKEPLKATGPRRVNRLEAVTVKKLKPGAHNDGNGLYLVVEPSGSRSWLLRTAVKGKRCEIGLGGLSTCSLAQARQEAADLRARARKGEDVLATRRAEKKKNTCPTFEEASKLLHKQVAPTLRNEHNKSFWLRSLDLHIFPTFGSKTVDTVDSSDVIRAIAPIWTKKPDVARKLLARIRRIMDWVAIQGYRNVVAGGMSFRLPNPCDGVRTALPQQPKEGRHAALDYTKLPDFILKLRMSKRTGDPVKLALEFTILTAGRTSETLFAEWKEFDIDNRTWNIPDERMKMELPHIVPLSDRVIEILEAARKLDPNSKYVFPSPDKPGEPLSNVSMLRTLKRTEEYKDFTVHGFRSSFKTWAETETGFNSKVIEASIAHKPQGVEGRYLRTTFPEQRRQLMEAWARYCLAKPLAKVVSIGGKR